MTNPQLWIAALEIGSFYGLMALGYLLILVGSGFFNFALGPYAMVAGLGASWLTIYAGMPKLLAVLAGIVMTVVVAILTELIVVRPVQRKAGTAELPALVAVSGVLFAVQQTGGLAFGRLPLPGQQLLQAGPWFFGEAVLLASTVVLVLVTVATFISATTWIRVSASGRLLRAVGDNKDAALILGLPVNRIRLIAFILGGLIAAIAGLLFSSKAGVSFLSGLSWTLSGFLALVIGGTGSLWAPLLGGLLLGTVQVFAPYYFGEVGPTTAVLLIALGFFAFRPQGLFVRRVRA